MVQSHRRAHDVRKPLEPRFLAVAPLRLAALCVGQRGGRWDLVRTAWLFVATGSEGAPCRACLHPRGPHAAQVAEDASPARCSARPSRAKRVAGEASLSEVERRETVHCCGAASTVLPCPDGHFRTPFGAAIGARIFSICSCVKHRWQNAGQPLRSALESALSWVRNQPLPSQRLQSAFGVGLPAIRAPRSPRARRTRAGASAHGICTTQCHRTCRSPRASPRWHRARSSAHRRGCRCPGLCLGRTG